MNNNISIPKEGHVDVVYIWCDANNPEYIKNRKLFSQESHTNSYWSPTRDHDEIMHSIKSVRKYMKWVRTIYVCAPKWHKIRSLDEKKYNVVYISNEEVLGEDNCPNFNSHSLELFTHKIKGLSNYFIQFNDDFFINSEVMLEDFYNFKTSKIKYYYENILHLWKWSSPTTRESIQSLTWDRYYFWSTHSPRMFFKKDIQDIVKNYKEIVDSTKKSRFRNKADLQLIHFYGYYLLSQNRGEFIFVKNTALSNSFTASLKILIKKILSENPIHVLYEIYLQILFKSKLHKDKVFSDEKAYSLIHIGDSSLKNRENIDFSLDNKIKFICLNDDYNSSNDAVLEKIQEDNYKYFFSKVLK